MAPRFEELPAELLVNITSHLTTIDYGSVRRTCSTVEKKLFDSFGKEFFKRRQFMLTQSSLQALIDISNHEALRGYLTKIIIGTNVIPDFRNLDRYNYPYAPSIIVTNSVDAETKTWQRQQYLEQRYFMEQGLDTPMLTEALNNLPSCHEIEIRDSYCPIRGRGDERWTSYGSTEFLKRCGLTKWQWWSDTEHQPRINHIFSTVTRAMATTAKARKYTAFMMTTRLFQNDLADDAFYQPNLVNFTEAFKSIKTLMLPIHTRIGSPDLEDFGSFLRLFPSLVHLRLNGTPNSNASEWLIAAKDAVSSCSIRRLDLGKMRLQPDVFKDFLSSLKALEHLELHWMTLVGSWVDTFSEVQINLPHLSVLKINMIISGSDAHHIHIGFKSSEEAVAKRPDDLKPTMECKGSNWLQYLKGRLVVQDAGFLGLDSEEESDSSVDSDDLDSDDLAEILGDSDGDSDSDEDEDEDMEDED